MKIRAQADVQAGNNLDMRRDSFSTGTSAFYKSTVLPTGMTRIWTSGT